MMMMIILIIGYALIFNNSNDSNILIYLIINIIITTTTILISIIKYPIITILYRLEWWYNFLNYRKYIYSSKYYYNIISYLKCFLPLFWDLTCIFFVHILTFRILHVSSISFFFSIICFGLYAIFVKTNVSALSLQRVHFTFCQFFHMWRPPSFLLVQ